MAQFLVHCYTSFNKLGYVILFCMISFTSIEAQITINPAYNESADLFNLMDNTSLWFPGYNEPEYREYWESTYGWSEEDQQWADRYKEYRKRIYSDSGQSEKDPRTARDGLFNKRSSMAKESDILSYHFMNSSSIEEAFSALPDIASEEDVDMLLAFYDHFREQWEEILMESRAFGPLVEQLKSEISGPGTDEYIQRIASFYNVSMDGRFNTYFVWWPPLNRTSGGIYGNSFLLNAHPERHKNETGWGEIAMHEYVHYVSAFQPPQQKQELTAAFLKGCPMEIRKGFNFYEVLEEPLAVAWGNAAFAKYGLEKELDPDENWYFVPLPSLMGRLLWPHVDKIYDTEATINDGIIHTAAGYCSDLLYVSKQIQKSE